MNIVECLNSDSSEVGLIALIEREDYLAACCYLHRCCMTCNSTIYETLMKISSERRLAWWGDSHHDKNAGFIVSDNFIIGSEYVDSDCQIISHEKNLMAPKTWREVLQQRIGIVNEEIKQENESFEGWHRIKSLRATCDVLGIRTSPQKLGCDDLLIRSKMLINGAVHADIGRLGRGLIHVVESGTGGKYAAFDSLSRKSNELLFQFENFSAAIAEGDLFHAGIPLLSLDNWGNEARESWDKLPHRARNCFSYRWQENMEYAMSLKS
ncbi:MAG: hypothetical protein AAB701_01435 [Patescibacteria group bacterium]